MNLRPTIPELVPGYVEVGIPPKRAVAYIVDSHMRSAIARGKGSKARRRAAKLRHCGEAALNRFAEQKRMEWLHA